MRPRKVLLAEDDADDQVFFTEFLKDREDIILLPIADNGELLFEILQGIQEITDLPDLIILDQNMPKINGLQTLQLLKADCRYAHIPVSIYSTYADELLTDKGLESGAFQVVAKPVSKQGYHQMMNAFFNAGI